MGLYILELVQDGADEIVVGICDLATLPEKRSQSLMQLDKTIRLRR